MTKNEYEVQFLKKDRVLDTLKTNGRTLEEIEKIIPDMKLTSWSKEVNEASKIEWRIIETVKQGVI